MFNTIMIDNQYVNYYSNNQHKPPKQAIVVQQSNAQHIIQAGRNNIATLWQGDFHQAKQVLSAVKKHSKIIPKYADDPTQAFHRYRLAQSQNSRLVNMLLVPINQHNMLDLSRAPEIKNVLKSTLDILPNTNFVLPLNQLLGMIGAYQWYQTGVFIPELEAKLHIPFGVFSPIRGEYVSLVKLAPLPKHCQIVWDIGTGSGVLAAVLAQRGVQKIIATDNNPRAICCAKDNIDSLGLSDVIEIQQTDAFPKGYADLIVCNPPWLPVKPTSLIETALYDPQHAMLHMFLYQAKKHLNSNGQIWLIMSDLAVHLGLRHADDLYSWFEQYGWTIVTQYQTIPQHKKAHNTKDPIAFARQKEITSLYILESA